MRKLLAVVTGMLSLAGFANEVPVVMQSGIDGAVIEEREVETGTTITTVAAPSVAGYIFTGWTSSDASVFSARDRLGRALEKATQSVYGETRLTANYVADDVDSDSDGIPDGYELYWYGNLDKSAKSDTDGDGYDFAAELAAGTNPLMVDRGAVGGIVWNDGEKVHYNPQGLPSYTIRSEPEGALFETICEFVKPGAAVTTASYGTDTVFAYWTTNGVRVADRLGRAQDYDIFTTPSKRRNPVIADMFQRMDLMERRGSGFKKIRDAYRYAPNFREDRTPCFTSDATDFYVMLPNLNYGIDIECIPMSADLQSGVTTITKTDTKTITKETSTITKDDLMILQMIRDNPRISAEEIGVQLGLTRAGAIYHINKLKSITKLRRIGTPRNGHWEVIAPRA